jgi:eukaryotic-like serine/threonine-protein kinase
VTTSSPTFGGRYQLLERIGTGGMAEVYRARDELLGRDVAVKVLSDRFSRDRSFVERFRREAQAAANLNHQNIVSLYDYGADHGTYFIVMEFIEGRTLGELISAEGPLMPERAAEIASDVTRALDRAHAAGLVHRDIKPGNIMITNTGETKVTDFGIARAMGSDSEATMTQAGMVIGTASYLSPEQAQGNPVDARSDIYSVGCVLFEMLTGRSVFAGDTPLSIAYKHVREQPETPSSVNPDVPRSLDAVTMKALAKNPDNRYNSASEMDDDLQRFLSGQRVHATPLMATETMVQERTSGTAVMTAADDEEEEKSRRGLFYALLTLLILALLALGGYFLVNSLLGEETVDVPDVVGERERQATEILEEAGFEVETERRASNRTKGEVFRQDPEAGEALEEGGTVTLLISSGPATVEVPDLSGLTEKEAEERLEEEGLELGEVTEAASDDIEEGQVVSQSVAAGTSVRTGTPVDVAISTGPEPTVVPSVVGFTEEAAVAEIEGAGLVAEVDRAENEAPEGQVFGQDPAGGTEVAPGDVVVIAVSTGPQEEAMPSVTGTPAEQAQSTLENEFGLNVNLVEETEPCDETPNMVCRQDPEPGTPVSEGDTVTLYIQPEGGPGQNNEDD